MADHRMTATSYLVLGLLSDGPATSYELKRKVAVSIGNFWEFAHSQLYDEPARLADAGLVDVETEPGGRRRRTYRITAAGRDALADWLAAPTPDRTDVRDPGLLKLFFARHARPRDIRHLAIDQRRSHRERADEYERIHQAFGGSIDRWQLKSLELGIRYERTVEGFWAELLDDLPET
ncbi:PadR family transcriptional regulator [Actinoallomurus oryzae]|uniref:PadR family transcriptional regulator n=1 Tax=Actinoallomurus oryzae TaxID=502180 RepID=A0ABP8Q660_9ACTN